MKPYEQLIEHAREIATIQSIGSILGWDQETMMPDGGVAMRGHQLSYLAKTAHEKSIRPCIGQWLDACGTDSQLTADPQSVSATNLRELRHNYDRATRLPTQLVEELAKVTSTARHAWAEARKNKSFEQFKPHLEKIVTLLREKARCLTMPEHDEPWDALADGFERGLLARDVVAVFDPLRESLVDLLGRVRQAPQPEDRFNTVDVPGDQQLAFVRFVAERLGFDFSRGRLDLSTHPFCGGIPGVDVRMTTRHAANMMGDCLGSTMHETGHGLYNQGLPEQTLLEPAGSHAGLSIHESQSRLWENMIGRSRAFWTWAEPELKRIVPGRFDELTAQDFYVASNRVEPSLIRVEADELTYNLHIMIRFDLERAMLKGDLSVADLPGAWNERYRSDLGLKVPDDAVGCMQDIHWSMGSMGYFPTYTYGNLLAAQFFEKACRDIPDLSEQVATGLFTPLLSWLRANIHVHGARYRAAELCQRVTDQPLSAEPLLRHLESRLAPVYGL
ncbi:MAG: carboxypeptidase M32 [Phycisphaeraceae bacterium]|nr:carboxypeptidase M32 [Phycisphaeraceae bacterium]